MVFIDFVTGTEFPQWRRDPHSSATDKFFNVHSSKKKKKFGVTNASWIGEEPILSVFRERPKKLDQGVNFTRVRSSWMSEIIAKK